MSVIQRTPACGNVALKEESEEKQVMETEIPVQEAPIDYHVPKKPEPPKLLKKYDIKILVPILKKLIVEKHKKLSKGKTAPELKLSEEELLKFLQRFHGLQKFFVAPDPRHFLKSGWLTLPLFSIQLLALIQYVQTGA